MLKSFLFNFCYVFRLFAQRFFLQMCDFPNSLIHCLKVFVLLLRWPFWLPYAHLKCLGLPNFYHLSQLRSSPYPPHRQSDHARIFPSFFTGFFMTEMAFGFICDVIFDSQMHCWKACYFTSEDFLSVKYIAKRPYILLLSVPFLIPQYIP